MRPIEQIDEWLEVLLTRVRPRKLTDEAEAFLRDTFARQGKMFAEFPELSGTEVGGSMIKGIYCLGDMAVLFERGELHSDDRMLGLKAVQFGARAAQGDCPIC